MDRAKKKTVQMTLGEYMTKTMLERLRGPSGQATVRRLTEVITRSVVETIAVELRAAAERNGGLVDVEEFLARLKPSTQ
jgi:hypothetical protein